MSNIYRLLTIRLFLKQEFLKYTPSKGKIAEIRCGRQTSVYLKDYYLPVYLYVVYDVVGVNKD